MPIPRMDPGAPRGALQRGYIRFARSPLGRWTGIHIASRIDPWLLRHTRGRLHIAFVLPVAMLTTRGARSGRERSTPVLYFNDGDDVVLIASSFGRERHPAWYHNLRAHPDAATLRARGAEQRFTARQVEGSERERLWAMGVSVYPGYEDYRRRVPQRTIPVMRLTPA